jgi:hypothetical protein
MQAATRLIKFFLLLALVTFTSACDSDFDATEEQLDLDAAGDVLEHVEMAGLVCSEWTNPSLDEELELGIPPVESESNPDPLCYTWQDCYWDWNVFDCGPAPYSADLKYCRKCTQCGGGPVSCGPYGLVQVSCNNTRG